jgi:plastocyanin
MHSILTSTTLLVSALAASVLATPQYGDSGSGSSSTDSSSATATASGASSSASNVHSVKVGPALTFTPDTVTAAQGDWVEFTFGEGHSVAQSSFASPCVPINGSSYVYSGFPNDGDVWRIQVNSTDPLWLYCSATGHCEGGMAMVVNPP